VKLLDRVATAIVQRSKPVQRLLQAAGDAIRESNAIARAQQPDPELELQRALFRERMNDMLTLRRAELACHNPQAFESMRESFHAVEDETQFKERLWELELALEDRGWVRETTLANLEFSRIGVQQLMRVIRVYSIKNPLVKRGAEICALYVFGRGIEIRAEDEAANAVIQSFLSENKCELAHTGLAEKEKSTQTDGSLYFGLVTDSQGNVKVQMIDPLEMMEVKTEPDNTAVANYFYRMWNRQEFNSEAIQDTNTPMKCWYPSVELAMNRPADAPQKIAGVDVNWDMPIFRVKVGAPANWRWGVPPLYAAVDWSRAYKDFLEDWSTVQRALSRFSLMVETKGGQGTIAAYQALLSTTFANNGGTNIERNPPPVTGSAHISGPDTKVTPFRTAGTQVAPEQSRRLLLMVASSLGLPETFFGDASTGSLATAVSLDRPTELKFTEIQRRWTETLTAILRYVLFVNKGTPGGKMREAKKSPKDPQIIVHFPNVVEHDIQKMIQAIAEVGTLGGRNGIAAGIVDRRTICDLFLQEIGVEDRDKRLDDMGYGSGYDPKDDIEDQRTMAAPQNITQQPDNPDDTVGNKPPTIAKVKVPPGKPKESLKQAIALLKEAVKRHGRN